MGLGKCKGCGGQVSKQAKTCPHCGAKGPGQHAQEAAKGLAFLVIIGGIVGLMLWPSADESEGGGEAPAQEQQAEPDCADDDASCWGREHLAAATRLCGDALGRLAEYEYEWTEPRHSRFPRVGWADDEHQVLRYMGDHIQYSNAFGSFYRHSYLCDFDPEAEEVVDVQVAAGRL